MMQAYLISAGAPNVSKISDNAGKWLYAAYIVEYWWKNDSEVAMHVVYT